MVSGRIAANMGAATISVNQATLASRMVRSRDLLGLVAPAIVGGAAPSFAGGVSTEDVSSNAPGSEMSSTTSEVVQHLGTRRGTGRPRRQTRLRVSPPLSRAARHQFVLSEDGSSVVPDPKCCKPISKVSRKPKAASVSKGNSRSSEGRLSLPPQWSGSNEEAVRSSLLRSVSDEGPGRNGESGDATRNGSSQEGPVYAIPVPKADRVKNPRTQLAAFGRAYADPSYQSITADEPASRTEAIYSEPIYSEPIFRKAAEHGRSIDVENAYAEPFVGKTDGHGRPYSVENVYAEPIFARPNGGKRPDPVNHVYDEPIFRGPNGGKRPDPVDHVYASLVRRNQLSRNMNVFSNSLPDYVPGNGHDRGLMAKFLNDSVRVNRESRGMPLFLRSEGSSTSGSSPGLHDDSGFYHDASVIQDGSLYPSTQGETQQGPWPIITFPKSGESQGNSWRSTRASTPQGAAMTVQETATLRDVPDSVAGSLGRSLEYQAGKQQDIARFILRAKPGWEGFQVNDADKLPTVRSKILRLALEGNINREHLDAFEQSLSKALYRSDKTPKVGAPMPDLFWDDVQVPVKTKRGALGFRRAGHWSIPALSGGSMRQGVLKIVYDQQTKELSWCFDPKPKPGTQRFRLTNVKGPGGQTISVALGEGVSAVGENGFLKCKGSRKGKNEYSVILEATPYNTLAA